MWLQLLLTIFAIFPFVITASDEVVTYGSVVKLIHKDTNYHLHSHNIAWGSGSGQQSVTATNMNSDQGSLWLVKDATTTKSLHSVGHAVKCGDKIRLEHVQTGKNLHSHLFKAPLSGNQEVSGFGENGYGDTGDNWILNCDESMPSKNWHRGGIVYMQHVDTQKYLSTSESSKFTANNCGQGCPIMGQTEISAALKKDSKSRWTTGQGIYFVPGKTQQNDEL